MIDFLESNWPFVVAIVVILADMVLANFTEITPETPKWKRLLVKISNYIALNWSEKAGK